MKLTEKNLKLALRQLGTQKREIYRSLKRLGIKGAPCDAECCPVSNYLVNKFNHGASVGTSGIYIAELSVDCPKVVSNFIVDFDHERFPDLIEWNNSND